jgi:copper(I)-binding protein
MRVVPLLLAAFLATPAFAQSPTVQVAQPWARATAPGQAVGAAYATLTSPAPDRLLGVDTPAAGRAEVHSTTMDGTVMRMRPVEGGVALPQGQPVVLAPGGLHIMLMGLKAPLRPGDHVSLTLRFEHAAPITVDAPVEPIGARGP